MMLNITIQLDQKKLAEINISDKINSNFNQIDETLTIEQLTMCYKAIISAIELKQMLPCNVLTNSTIGVINSDEF